MSNRESYDKNPRDLSGDDLDNWNKEPCFCENPVVVLENLPIGFAGYARCECSGLVQIPSNRKILRKTETPDIALRRKYKWDAIDNETRVRCSCDKPTFSDESFQGSDRCRCGNCGRLIFREIPAKPFVQPLSFEERLAILESRMLKIEAGLNASK
jgi:hypothetical protein